MRAAATQSCGNWALTTTITRLTVGGVPVDVSRLAPNKPVRAGPATIVLNEQSHTTGPSSMQSTVTAVHLRVDSLLAKADVTIGSATADAHNCV